MGKSKDLAIIIPIRNTHIYLIKRCLKSVFNAIKYSEAYDIDVTVIDDCSDEKHYNEYSSYIKKNFPEIIIQRLEKWKGIGGARNVGASLSEVKYLLFMDSDDVMRKNAIATLMEHSSEKRIVFANHIKVDNDRTILFNKQIFLEILNDSYKIMDCPFLYTNLICMPVIIPKKLFTQVRGYPERIYSGENVALYGKVYFESNLEELVHIDEVLYEYHVRKDGNCFKDLQRHFAGKRQQFEILARSVGLNAVKYISYPSKHNNISSLYIPVFQNNKRYIPPWADIENNVWNVNKKLIKLFEERQATSYKTSYTTHFIRSNSAKEGTSCLESD